MALHTFDTVGLRGNREFLDVNALAAPQTLHASAYRCAGCGSRIAFDALMLTCDCMDDPGAPVAAAGRVAPASPGGH